MFCIISLSRAVFVMMFAGMSLSWKPNTKLTSVGYNPIILMPIRLILQFLDLQLKRKFQTLDSFSRKLKTTATTLLLSSIKMSLFQNLP
jgi:hypothetical protein